MNLLVGFDIGGTKCAAVFAANAVQKPEILHREAFPTPTSWQETFDTFCTVLDSYLQANPQHQLAALGISCGGPLDAKQGIILSPPNLKGWDTVACYSYFGERYRVPVALQNDADACALAEWRWGAGIGTQNMVFLTFGTGMGAGLILGGQLYTGTSNLAGEVGHIRMAEDGPEGYGKHGSFEGFCSGGGIARMGREMAYAHGTSLNLADDIDARTLGKAAAAGEPFACEVYRRCAFYLGRGLALLIDLLNPERIILGSIFQRQEGLLRPIMEQVLKEEALAASRRVCEILPAGLGEEIGDYACLSIAASIVL